MARSEKQKQKLFRLFELLLRETDEEHGLSVNELITRLAEQGIGAERKSIYDDFLALEELGFPVIKLASRPPRYYIEPPLFELAELKLLVDAVEVSKFITRGKSREMIAKLEALAGARRSRELSRQVYVEDRVKTMNAASLYNIDAVHAAINAGTKLSFQYFSFDAEKRRVLKNGGTPYVVSPCALLWSDENYYLVALDETADTVKNFRVDKMQSVQALAAPRKSDPRIDGFNHAAYSRRVFGMYGGREELVTLECREALAGAMLDRFGDEVTFVKSDFGFRFTVRLIVSPNFFAWVLGFGAAIRIAAPESVRTELIEKMREIAKNYTD